jgi:integrase
MPQAAASNVKGLYKHHNRGCPNKGRKPTNCDCPWYGYYRRVYKGLAQWCGQEVDPRTRGAAEVALNRLKAAIDNRTYSPEGEQRSLGSGQRFSEFVKEWTTHYAEAHGLSSNSLKPMLNVLVAGFGNLTLEHLAGAPLQIERWLNSKQKDKRWSDNTWNRYYELLNSLFNRAVKWKTNGVPRIALNPMASIEKRTGAKKKFETRVEESVEQMLIDACDQLNRPQHKPHSQRLTWEIVSRIRERVESGEQQSRVAAEYKISTGLCCQIIKGDIWNPSKYRKGTKGDEMRRRLYAAFDLGLRHGEIVKIQLKHIDFRPLRVDVDGVIQEVFSIALPTAVSKGGKTTGEIEHVYAGTERLKEELVKRRFILRRNPDAYVFGTEDGRAIKGFKRMWRELFKLAKLDYGRSKGLVWHTIRHEFVSRHVENTGDPVIAQRLARHKDGQTTQGYMHARESRVLAAAVRIGRRSR